MIGAGSRGLRLCSLKFARRLTGAVQRPAAWLVLAMAAALVPSAGLSAQDAEAGAAEPRRFVFSRAAQQDSDGFYYQRAGLCEDYPEETTTSAKIAADFEVLRETGTKLLRFGIGWDGVETAPGQYDWHRVDEIVEAAARDGVTLLPYVCYTPEWAASGDDHWREPPRNLDHFGRFMFAIASRYRGKVKSWELWNEPDNRDYWRGSPKQFAAMFESGARAVRRADPDAVVVLGGLAQPPGSAFSQAILKRHHLLRWFDVVNFHAYLETWENTPAEELPGRVRGYEAAIQARRAVGLSRDVWLAEFGYSSLRPRVGRVSSWVRAHHAHEHTPEFQAVALLRQHVLSLAAQRLSLTAWFRIRDLPEGEAVIGDANNRHFGIVDRSGGRKPAFAAMRLWNALMSQAVRTARIEQKLPVTSAAEVHVFERGDGSLIVAAWMRAEKLARKGAAAPAADERREILDVQLPRGDPLQLRVHRGAVADQNALEEGVAGVLPGVIAAVDEIFIAELRQR